MTTTSHPLDAAPVAVAEPRVPADAATALAARLRVAAAVLVPGSLPEPSPDPSRDAASVLDLAVRSVQERVTPERVWLLLVAVQAGYPTADDVREACRHYELVDRVEAATWTLDTCLRENRAYGARQYRIELVIDAVIVDVDLAARLNYHTGIQQVIRNTMPRWDRDHEIRLGAWTGTPHQALRVTTPAESDRVLRWHGRPTMAPSADVKTPDALVMVPWRSVVVIADIPTVPALSRLSAIGEFSGNAVTAIGYDAIPLVSTHLVPVGAAEHHARYMSCIKHAVRVGAISATARSEFAGFVDMLPAQGLTGPTVLECRLPADRHARPDSPEPGGTPTVLGVGSLEPRKNHVALLFAAEVLWNEGIPFTLRLIGGNRWGQEISDVVDRLVAAGHPLVVDVGVDQDELDRAFVGARFTVFASIHEGYGLPVAESLGFGTPVITSDFGSTAEIAAGGGALTIDPRDDDALIDAMRSLLVDDDALAALRAQIPGRPRRTWDDYARELWAGLIDPALAALADPTGTAR